MAFDHSDERRHAHTFLDRLPDDAPIDDKPVTSDEVAAVQIGISSLEQNGWVPLE